MRALDDALRLFLPSSGWLAEKGVNRSAKGEEIADSMRFGEV